jgi:glucuronoarabinoxylan endo-1,4-beta-xylanase
MILMNHSIYKITGVLVSAFLVLSCSNKNGGGGGSTPPPPVAAEITVLANDTKQLIQGFGCATVFNPPGTTPITNEEFDRLFGSNGGQVGLNILRIRVASDDAWRVTELNYAKAAIQRGARVMASPWSPPARMKTNNNLVGGSLIADSGAAYAKYLNDFANYMATNNATLYAVSVQNEPDIAVTYESCEWTADQMRLFLRNHGHLVTSTKLMAPESFNNNLIYVNNILGDDVAAANVDLVGGHIYGNGIVENDLAKTKNKEVWMTEHLDEDISYNGAMNTAIEIHDCLTKANFNAYIWWYGKRFYGPIGQDGMVTARGYVMSHFARFVKPGSVRIGTSSNSVSGVYISAFINTGKKVIVAINNKSTVVNQTIKVQDVTAGEFMPYTTTGSTNVVQGTKITAAGNAIIYSLPAYSITTFVEQ